MPRQGEMNWDLKYYIVLWALCSGSQTRSVWLGDCVHASPMGDTYNMPEDTLEFSRGFNDPRALGCGSWILLREYKLSVTKNNGVVRMQRGVKY